MIAKGETVYAGIQLVSLGKALPSGAIESANKRPQISNAVQDNGLLACLAITRIRFGSVRIPARRTKSPKSPSFCFLYVRAEARTLQGRKPYAVGPLLLVEGRVDRASDWLL